MCIRDSPGEAIAYQYRGANDLARTFFAYFSRETEGYMPASACNRTTLRNVVSLYDSGRQIFGDDVVGSGGYDDGSSSSNGKDSNGVIVSDSGTYDDNTVPNQGHVTSQQPTVIVDQSSQGTTPANPPATVSTNVPKSNFTGIVFPEMTCKSMNPGSMGFRVELGKDEEGTSKVAVFKDFGFGIESLIDVRPASVEQRKSFPLRRCKSWINYAFEDSRNDLDLDFKTPKNEDGSRSMKADFRLKSESEYYQYKGELECQMTPDFLERRKRCLEL